MQPTEYEFKDATKLTAWTRDFLYALIGITVAGLISKSMARHVLIAIDEGRFASKDAMMAAAESSDLREGIIAVPNLVIIVVSGILTLLWIRRANWNARARGAAADMTFTPGWAIGWYFIPIMNLFKPYQAMKEIWWASVRPRGRWHDEPGGTLLGAWWALWLVDNSVSNMAFRMSLTAKQPSQHITANALDLAGDALLIPLCVVLLIIIKHVDTLQRAPLPPEPATPPLPSPGVI